PTGQSSCHCTHSVPRQCSAQLGANLPLAGAEQCNEQRKLNTANDGCGQNDDRRDQQPAKNLSIESDSRERTQNAGQNRESIAQCIWNSDRECLQAKC